MKKRKEKKARTDRQHLPSYPHHSEEVITLFFIRFNISEVRKAVASLVKMAGVVGANGLKRTDDLRRARLRGPEQEIKKKKKKKEKK
jgi:hypothetical protein